MCQHDKDQDLLLLQGAHYSTSGNEFYVVHIKFVNKCTYKIPLKIVRPGGGGDGNRGISHGSNLHCHDFLKHAIRS